MKPLFGQIAARAFGDALYDELTATWGLFFGEPSWDAAGRTFGYRRAGLPLLFENGFPLLARTTSPAHNLRTWTTAAWDPARFAHPFLASVGDPDVFINQAVYDPARARLVLTVNGGAVVDAPVELTVEQLPAGRPSAVVREGVRYLAIRRDDARLVIRTPALSSTEETYEVMPEAEAPAPLANATVGPGDTGDAAEPGRDAAEPGRDAAEPGRDAAEPGRDAAEPGRDAAAPGLDAGPPEVDAAPELADVRPALASGDGSTEGARPAGHRSDAGCAQTPREPPAPSPWAVAFTALALASWRRRARL